MTNLLVPRLSAALEQEFGRWFQKSSRVFMTLDRKAIFYREVRRAGERAKTHGFIDLPHVLRAGLDRAGLLDDLLDWSRIVRPFAVAGAARFAARLAAQIGVEPEFRISTSRDRAAEAALHAGLETAREEARAAVPRVVRALTRAVLERPGVLGLSGRASRLRIRSALGRLFADWRDAEDRLLHREALPELLDAVWSSPTQELAREMRRARDARRRLQGAGDRLLRTVCPAAPRAVMSAPASRAARIRVFRTVYRGISMDAWIVIHPLRARQDLGSCTLCVRRGHDSFVIESSDKILFYFPPSLLVSTISFRADRWWAGLPLVFEPRNGYPLKAHPYTGLLGRGHGAVTDMGERTCPLLPELTGLEAMLFPAVTRRTRVSAANDLCLVGQSNTLKEISLPLRGAEEAGREPDVLGFFIRALDIARRGLTYAHQLNLETPRTALIPGALPYTVSPQRLAGHLAERCFPFDPRRVSGSGAVTD